MCRRLFIVFVFLFSSFQVSALTVGVLANTSGNEAVFDQPALAGLQLAVRITNKKGGVAGHKIRLNIKRGDSTVATMQKLSQALANNPKVDFVISVGDSRMVAVAAPILANASKLLISSSATDTNLSQQKNLILLAFTDAIQASAAAQFAANQMHLKQAAALYQANNAYARAVTGYFNDAYSHFEGKVLMSAKFQGDKLSAALIDQLRKHQPNIIFMSADAKGVLAVIKQLRQAGFKQPIMGGDSYLASEISELGSSTADNVYYATHGFYDSNFMEPNMSRFVKAYQKHYGKKPSTIYSGLGYDAMQLLVTGLQKAKNPTVANVKATLGRLSNFNAVTGDLNLTQTPANKIVTVVKLLSAKARIAAMVIPQYTATKLSFPNRYVPIKQVKK